MSPLVHCAKHIEVCALEDGYLKEITIKEGQAVKKGDLFVPNHTNNNLQGQSLTPSRQRPQLAN